MALPMEIIFESPSMFTVLLEYLDVFFDQCYVFYLFYSPCTQ